MDCGDRAPDLLARALGQLPPDEDAALASHLASCGECTAEDQRLRAEIAASRTAAAPAPHAVLTRILDAVRDEAADRRAEHAVASSRSCPGVREDLPALVLRSLAPEDEARVAAHVAACAPCAEERDVTARLVAAQRAVPVTALPADGLARILGAVRTESPAPAAAPELALLGRSAPPPARPKWWIVAFPIAAAAAVLAALWAAPETASGVRVCTDSALVHRPKAAASGATAIVAGRAQGAFAFGLGDELEATDVTATFKMSLRGTPGDGALPGPDELVIDLAPGSVVARAAPDALELRRGRLTVRAGRLGHAFEVRNGDLYAAVRGTDFDVDVLPPAAERPGAVSADGARLLVLLRTGQVEIGRRGGASKLLDPGAAGLADAVRVVTAPAGSLPSAVDALLAPRMTLSGPAGPVPAGAPLELRAELAANDGGPVTIPGFDDSEPRLVVRLKGADGREREVKVQRSMVIEGAGGAGTDGPAVRIVPGSPWRLRLRIEGLDLAPGVWEASLRHHAYGPRRAGVEWSGAAESPPVRLTITSADKSPPSDAKRPR